MSASPNRFGSARYRRNRCSELRNADFRDFSKIRRAALPPGGNRVHIYDNPLQVLAALLAVGFVLTLLVRPLKKPQYQTT